MKKDTGDVRDLLAACAAGDETACRLFQDEYGEDVYNFPVKIYRLPLEEAGDFYLYTLEKGRIFSRLRTFEGRNSIQFRTFLSYYVLKHLFLEWQRGRKAVETVSLQSPLDTAGEGTVVLEDVLSDPASAEVVTTAETAGDGEMKEVWNALRPDEQLDLKLLSLLEYDLSPDDVSRLAEISRRSVIETVVLVAEIQGGLKSKDEKVSRLKDELDSVWGWIIFRQKELQEIDEKIRLLSHGGTTAGRERLLSEKRELEQSLAKRYRQKARLTEEMLTYKLTTPYKDIARLLNLSVGTVCSRIFRLREKLEAGLRGMGEGRSV